MDEGKIYFLEKVLLVCEMEHLSLENGLVGLFYELHKKGYLDEEEYKEVQKRVG